MGREGGVWFDGIDISVIRVVVAFVAFLPTSLHAQSSIDASTIVPGLTSIASTTSGSSSISSTASDRSMTTSISSSGRNSTSSTPTPSATNNPNQDFFPGVSNSNTPSSKNRNNDVINYYFLFLALFGVLVAVFLWWVHKRRKQRKEAMRLSGQHALARDMDGWINTRRWFHGTGRHNQTATFVRREEGLDERGEPPPPYRPKSEEGVDVIQERGPDGIAIPLRTLARDDIEQGRPPDYRESISHAETARRPETSHTYATRPDTAELGRSPSTRDLMRTRNSP
ncbi:hypothetical protein P280DRAFT_256564 [Massarina eburnea CBS 473.64]|uniref:Uncharacterized protein n=1 Tax=Massarina eburnea CBS 473.64 TaxID=1395130 RepID=A0A6A6SBQ5_9PLEO|nr:hypothetical protein P280DRAFT_256564 [Massarina eburnea CBS 473.64]